MACDRRDRPTGYDGLTDPGSYDHIPPPIPSPRPAPRRSIFAAFLIAPLLIGAPVAQADAQHWSRSWAAAVQAPLSVQANRPVPDLADRTIRQVVRLSAGGTALRLRLSNEMSDAALPLRSIRVALAGEDGTILAGTTRIVTFGGQQSVRIAPHAPAVSDAIAFKVAPLQRLAISIHVVEPVAAPTLHSHAAATGWIAPGDQTAARVLTGRTNILQRLVIAAVDVDNPRPARTIVALGDSITDGARATVDADRRYPDRLAERLVNAGMTDVAVANAGIGGNRLLDDGTGPNALARLDRDVLSVPGVSHVIVLEGVNDIGSAVQADRPPPTADALIGGYRQIIARAHERGVKVVLATILPYKGARYWSAGGETVRAATNAWIRTQREAYAMVDFDRAVRDPADPQALDKAFDGGDALHPNDAGFAAMARAVDLALLK